MHQFHVYFSCLINQGYNPELYLPKYSDPGVRYVVPWAGAPQKEKRKRREIGRIGGRK